MAILDPPAIDVNGKGLASFTPIRDLPNLAAWYDASTLPGANESAIKLWKDASGRSSGARGQGATLPVVKAAGLGGLKTAKLGATGYFYASTLGAGGILQPTGIAQPLTYIALVKANSSAGITVARYLAGGSAGNLVNLSLGATTGGLFLNAGSNGANGGKNLSDDSWHVVVAVIDTGSAALFVDGYLVNASATQSHGTNLLSNLQIGNQSSSANVLQGEIAEFMVCGSRLTLTQIKRVTKYLNDKWTVGLTVPTQDDVQYFDTVDSAGVNCRVWLPTTIGESSPAVFWSHQAGGTEQITTGYSLYPVVHALVNAGYVVAASRMHGDSWGDAQAVTDLNNLYTLVNGIQPISRLILLGTSMGGVATSLMQPLGGLPAGKLKGCIGLDAVFSLASMYANATYTTAIDTAYGCTRGTLSGAMAATGLTKVPTTASYPTIGTKLMLGNGTANVETVTTTGASTGTEVAVTATTKTHASADQVSDFPSKAEGHDPLSRSANDFSAVRWRFYASTEDATVNETANTKAMQTLLNGATIPPAEDAIVQHLGGHVSPNAVIPDDVIAFVERCV
jgi:hypothetical protein